MMHSRTSAARTALSGALLLLSIGLASPAIAQTRSIEGTYQLVSRTLADGTVLKPPAIMGLQTYTKTHRNFNLLVKDKAGTFQSFSYVSTYRLTNAGYSETLSFSVINDPSSGENPIYDVSGETRTVPVKAEGQRLEFRAPFDPTSFIFDGGAFSATFPDGRVDAWERVD